MARSMRRGSARSARDADHVGASHARRASQPPQAREPCSRALRAARRTASAGGAPPDSSAATWLYAQTAITSAISCRIDPAALLWRAGAAAGWRMYFSGRTYFSRAPHSQPFRRPRPPARRQRRDGGEVCRVRTGARAAGGRCSSRRLRDQLPAHLGTFSSSSEHNLSKSPADAAVGVRTVDNPGALPSPARPPTGFCALRRRRKSRPQKPFSRRRPCPTAPVHARPRLRPARAPRALGALLAPRSE